MSPWRFAAALGAVALSSLAAGVTTVSAGTHVQHASLTIRSGDRIQEPNLALAPGVPVQLAVTNYTHEFHSFTVPALGLSVLVLPAHGHSPTTTTVSFTSWSAGPLRWHCAICPSGMHGRRHEMSGTLYLVVRPSALP